MGDEVGDAANGIPIFEATPYLSYCERFLS